MRRNTVILFLLLACMSCLATRSYACDLPPYAYINLPDGSVVCSGGELTLDGSWSFDPDENFQYIVSWKWDIWLETEGGWEKIDSASGATVDYRFTTPGKYSIDVNVCDDEGDSTIANFEYIWVERADKIEISRGGFWEEVTGQTKTILRGSKYTFRARPYPDGAWPANAPQWSHSGTVQIQEYSDPVNGKYVVASFDEPGTVTLTARCCTEGGKTVTINVVEPTVYQVGFTGVPTMYYTPSTVWDGWGDGETEVLCPQYDTVLGTNGPACVPKNSNSISLLCALRVPQILSYSTSVIVDTEDANSTEEWNESGGIGFNNFDPNSG